MIRAAALAAAVLSLPNGATGQTAFEVKRLPCTEALEILRGNVPGTEIEQMALMGYVVGQVDMMTIWSVERDDVLPPAEPYMAYFERIEAQCREQRWMPFGVASASALRP